MMTLLDLLGENVYARQHKIALCLFLRCLFAILENHVHISYEYVARATQSTREINKTTNS